MPLNPRRNTTLANLMGNFRSFYFLRVKEWMLTYFSYIWTISIAGKVYLTIMLLKRGKTQLHFLSSHQLLFTLCDSMEQVHQLSSGWCYYQHWKLKLGFYRKLFGKGKGEIISSCNLGETWYFMLHSLVQFPTKSLIWSLYNSEQSMQMHPILKGTYLLREMKSLAHLIKWMRDALKKVIFKTDNWTCIW